MKKIIALLLSLALVFALAGCGLEPIEEPAPVTSQEPTVVVPVAPIQSIEPVDPVPATSQEPTVEVPVSPERPALPVFEGGLIGILGEIDKNYRPGTAGSGMIGFKCAAMLLDWFEQNPNVDTVTGSAANFAAIASIGDGDFASKLLTLWTNAVSLSFGQHTGELESVGYVPLYKTWNAENTQKLFEAMYAGLGLELPALITVYYGDDNVEHLLTTVYPAEAVDEFAVMGALKAVGTVNRDVMFNSFTLDGKTIRLDVSKEFQDQLCSYGTSGEIIMMGSVVRTYLEAFQMDDIVITVDGKTLESGHEIYGYAIPADHYML